MNGFGDGAGDKSPAEDRKSSRNIAARWKFHRAPPPHRQTPDWHEKPTSWQNEGHITYLFCHHTHRSNNGGTNATLMLKGNNKTKIWGHRQAHTHHAGI